MGQKEERERSAWPHSHGPATCLLLLSSICSHLAWRGHPPASPLGCLLALPPGQLYPEPSQGFASDPASLLLSPQLSSNLQLLTAHISWRFFIPLSTCSPLCLSLSSSVDITNRNIMLSFPSFQSTSSSSVFSIFVLAGLPTCIEIYSRNSSSSFGPSFSLPLWHFLLSLSAELSRFFWENQWALLWPTISSVWPTLPFRQAQLWLAQVFWGLQPLLLWRSDTAAVPLLQNSISQGTGPWAGHAMVCMVNQQGLDTPELSPQRWGILQEYS